MYLYYDSTYSHVCMHVYMAFHLCVVHVYIESSKPVYKISIGPCVHNFSNSNDVIVGGEIT